MMDDDTGIKYLRANQSFFHTLPVSLVHTLSIMNTKITLLGDRNVGKTSMASLILQLDYLVSISPYIAIS